MARPEMGEDAGGYEWDVFVSYRREPPGRAQITPWITRVVDVVKFWLGQELGGEDPRMFFDTRVVAVGSRWQVELRRAVATSRCLLAIWSPAYFRSQWCIAEWRSFVKREQLMAAGTCLIVPVKFHDGEWFPDDARQVECLDLSPYAVTMPAFWETRRAVELEEVLQDLARRLAHVVSQAPAYREDWPDLDPFLADVAEPPRNLPMRRL